MKERERGREREWEVGRERERDYEGDVFVCFCSFLFNVRSDLKDHNIITDGTSGGVGCGSIRSWRRRRGTCSGSGCSSGNSIVIIIIYFMLIADLKMCKIFRATMGKIRYYGLA